MKLKHYVLVPKMKNSKYCKNIYIVREGNDSKKKEIYGFKCFKCFPELKYQKSMDINLILKL